MNNLLHELQLPMPPLIGLVFIIALLYSTVGFGGASGYLAAMSFFNIPFFIASSTALTLNVIVAGIAFYRFYKDGHLKTRLLLPFIFTSIPASFLGGSIRINQQIYQILLSVVLLYIAISLLFFNQQTKDGEFRSPPSYPISLMIGIGIGLLSGIVGVGGGIFLSPLIILARWGDSKSAAATSAGFIFLNSIAGLAGRAWAGGLSFGNFGLLLIPVGIIASYIGSHLGASRFSGKTVERLLGVILLIAVSWNGFSWFR